MNQQVMREINIGRWLDVTLETWMTWVNTLRPDIRDHVPEEISDAVNNHVANWVGMLAGNVEPQTGIQALALSSDGMIGWVLDDMVEKRLIPAP